MFRTWLTAMAIALMPMSAIAQMAYIEGQDYQAIAEPVDTGQPDKVVVTEIFWYGCPHCFRFESYLEKWSKDLPENVVFEQVPAVGSNEVWPRLARTHYALQAIGELERIQRRLFDAIHIERKLRQTADLDQIAAYLAGQGIDEQAFREAYNSFSVETRIRKNKQNEKRYGLDAVPTIIVNGKYLIGSDAGSFARMLEVTDFLVNRDLQQ